MHTILTVIFVLTTCVIVSAQQSCQDAVYLKNGGIIRGRVLEQIPNKQLTIETVGRIIIVYKIDEIAKVYKRTYPTQEPSYTPGSSGEKKEEPGEVSKSTKEPVKAPTRSSSFNLSGLKKGNSAIVELGYAQGYGTGYLNFFKISIIGNHRLNQYISLGIGTGCRYYPPSSVIANSGSWSDLLVDSSVQLSPSIVIPLLADLRVNIINNHKVTPYFSLGIGYSFVATSQDTLYPPSWTYPTTHWGGAFYNAEQTGLYQGGFLLNPSLGVSYKVSDKCAVKVSIGYEMQRATVRNRKELQLWYVGMGGSAKPGAMVETDNLSVVNSSRISINSGISF